MELLSEFSYGQILLGFVLIVLSFLLISQKKKTVERKDFEIKEGNQNEKISSTTTRTNDSEKEKLKDLKGKGKGKEKINEDSEKLTDSEDDDEKEEQEEGEDIDKEQEILNKKIEREAKETMDARKYNPEYEEYDIPSEDFQILKRNTKCPFAKNSRVMNGSKWNSSLTLEDNVKNSISLLEIFNQRVEDGEDLDGFLFEIEDLRYGETIENLSKTVLKVLNVISENDPSGEHAMKEELRSNFWNFHFGVPYAAYFISVLAPCYSETNSRYPYGSTHTFILLQPEISFTHKAIKLDYDPRSVRHLVRKRFDAAGQHYDHRDSKEYTMCNWVVRPLYSHLPALRWWESDISDWN